MRGILIAALLVGTLISGCMFWQPGAVSEQKFVSLQLGMARQEVEAVVGSLGLVYESPSYSKYAVTIQGKSQVGTPLCYPAYLSFDKNGILIEKSRR